MKLVTFILLFTLITMLASCEREQRSFQTAAPSSDAPQHVRPNVSIRPGGTGEAHVNPPAYLDVMTRQQYGAQYANNAQAQSDGQTLYEAFNCVGCHAHGGGGIAPPLIDNKWLYGSNPDQVYQTILEGRPGGMPSFRGRIADYQVWEIVAYVRSLSGRADPNAATGREDHLQANPPPNSQSEKKPMPVPTTSPATGPAVTEVHMPSTSPATAPTTEPVTSPTTQPSASPATSPSTAPSTEPSTAPASP
jgi:cytochrome c oxidase cbb3-type subunit 3